MGGPPLTTGRAEYLLNSLVSLVRQLPPDGLFETFHDLFGRIRTNGFWRAREVGLISFELAAPLKYVIVYGEYRKKRRRYDMAPYLNAVKDLWQAAEQDQAQTADANSKATFLLRFFYASMPFSQHQDSIDSEKSRALSLFVRIASQQIHRTFDFRREFLDRYHLTPEEFIHVGWEIFQAFRRRVDWTREGLESTVPSTFKPFVAQALEILAASRKKFRQEYFRVRAVQARQAPYEPNPLMWMPIITVQGHYYAPYPELVAYAASRGLFFRCGGEWGGAFPEAFGDWFEHYVGDLLRTRVQGGQVIGAAEERELGYVGKNVDWTVLMGSSGLLIECKSSALFRPGKVLATPASVKKDLATNLVGKGKGLFQLYEKLQAIRKRNLPTVLMERYANITTWYPVVILYDQIQHANNKQVLRNLLDSALREAGISEFNYQIWHVEELENFLDLVPEEDLIPEIHRKWEDPEMSQWDLNTYLYSVFEQERLRSYIVVPKDSIPYRILEELAD